MSRDSPRLFRPEPLRPIPTALGEENLVYSEAARAWVPRRPPTLTRTHSESALPKPTPALKPANHAAPTQTLSRASSTSAMRKGGSGLEPLDFDEAAYVAKLEQREREKRKANLPPKPWRY